MTWHRPNFRDGLFGAANRFVTNAWTDSADAVKRNAEGLAWAQQQVVSANLVKFHLCTLKSATLVTPNIWKYQVTVWSPPHPAGGGVADPADKRFDWPEVWNLREFHNTASVVDGMDITNPPVSVGPVGSTWNGTAWTLTPLQAKVNVWVVYDLAGKAYPYFDRPNPVRCETQEGEG